VLAAAAIAALLCVYAAWESMVSATPGPPTTYRIAGGRPEKRPLDGKGFPALSPDGAWCWVQDPRAVYHKGRHRRTYSGWVTRAGALQVASYDHETREVRVVTLRKRWHRNDHANPAFLVRADGRIMAFYSTHNGKRLFSRVSKRPEDISAWDDEIIVSSQGRITYPNPMQLSAENDCIYVLWRGRTWKPTFAVSDDGVTWSAPKVLIQEKGREAHDIRPYLKAACDGVDTFHLAFTDGHPRDEPQNSIYYAKYRNGAFHKADGTRIKGINDLPIRHSEADRVYDARQTNVRAWIWDVAGDASQNPVIVYTRLPKESDHRYHYARWDGAEWRDHEITAGGGWFPQTREGKKEREPHYSGGIALDHADPSVVYLSRPTDGVFEIEKWTTPDGGATWNREPISAGSAHNNVRPVVPHGWRGVGDHVLWMHGEYVGYYAGYDTAIRMVAP